MGIESIISMYENNASAGSIKQMVSGRFCEAFARGIASNMPKAPLGEKMRESLPPKKPSHPPTRQTTIAQLTADTQHAAINKLENFIFHPRSKAKSREVESLELGNKCEEMRCCDKERSVCLRRKSRRKEEDEMMMVCFLVEVRGVAGILKQPNAIRVIDEHKNGKKLSKRSQKISSKSSPFTSTCQRSRTAYAWKLQKIRVASPTSHFSHCRAAGRC